MHSAFAGEIRAFPYYYAPEDWLNCDGRYYNKNFYPLLFEVIRFTYGQNGDNFAVPNLSCAVAVGSGLSYPLGQTGGDPSVKLSNDQIGNHNHLIEQNFLAYTKAPGSFSNGPRSTSFPGRYIQPTPAATFNAFTTHAQIPVQLASKSLDEAQGNNEMHENRQPFLALRYCICWNGDMPVA